MIRSMSARIGALITANCLAALTVGVLTLAGVWIGAVVSPGDGGVATAVGWGFSFGLIAAFYSFAISFPFFLVGLIVVGIPTWWALHQTGMEGRGAFLGIAAMESVIAGAFVFRLIAPGSEVAAPLLAIPGALAGWAIWTYGYSRVASPVAEPC